MYLYLVVCRPSVSNNTSSLVNERVYLPHHEMADTPFHIQCTWHVRHKVISNKCTQPQTYTCDLGRTLPQHWATNGGWNYINWITIWLYVPSVQLPRKPSHTLPLHVSSYVWPVLQMMNAVFAWGRLSSPRWGGFGSAQPVTSKTRNNNHV